MGGRSQLRPRTGARYVGALDGSVGNDKCTYWSSACPPIHSFRASSKFTAWGDDGRWQCWPNSCASTSAAGELDHMPSLSNGMGDARAVNRMLAADRGGGAVRSWS